MNYTTNRTKNQYAIIDKGVQIAKIRAIKGKK